METKVIHTRYEYEYQEKRNGQYYDRLLCKNMANHQTYIGHLALCKSGGRDYYNFFPLCQKNKGEYPTAIDLDSLLPKTITNNLGETFQTCPWITLTECKYFISEVQLQLNNREYVPVYDLDTQDWTTVIMNENNRKGHFYLFSLADDIEIATMGGNMVSFRYFGGSAIDFHTTLSVLPTHEQLIVQDFLDKQAQENQTLPQQPQTEEQPEEPQAEEQPEQPEQPERELCEIMYLDAQILFDQAKKETWTEETLLDYLRPRLYPDRMTVNEMLNLMICVSQGFLTIFSGAPGGGKTSLCKRLGKTLGLLDSKYTALNNRFVSVSVGRAWTSKSDLLGYFNPITQQFDRSNGVMYDNLKILDWESLEKRNTFPCLTLLDEANLSPVEYYWADFMDICDHDNKDLPRGSINLGGQQLNIPDTLRFLATINNDRHPVPSSD